MTKPEEIYLLSKLLSKAQADKSVEFNKHEIWKDLLLNNTTQISEDYFLELDKRQILNYEEIGEEGFQPIIMCSITPETEVYLKRLILDVEKNTFQLQEKIDLLNIRIVEILTFDPNKLHDEIKSTENIIIQVKEQIKSNQILQSLSSPLDTIEAHFKSISQVANNYENIYKNIILPVKEEGKSGVRQTVKWAIISIIISTLFSIIISFLFARK